MSGTAYVLRHPRTHMFIATKERPKNIRFGAGFGQDYRWVRKIEEADLFGSYSDAELPALFLRLTDYEIRPLLSCGIAGDPVSREDAMANGTFHSARGVRIAQPQSGNPS